MASFKNRIAVPKKRTAFSAHINHIKAASGNQVSHAPCVSHGIIEVLKGIENRLSPELVVSEDFLAQRDRFYRTVTEIKGYQEKCIREVFNKAEFCQWVCEERSDQMILKTSTALSKL